MQKFKKKNGVAKSALKFKNKIIFKQKFYVS